MSSRFIRELRRRRVPQVAGFFLAAGWVIIEVADATFPRLGLPDWTVTLVLVLLLLAFPLVVGLTWLYDITPDGIRRTSGEAEPPVPVRAADDADAAEAGESASQVAIGRIAVTGAIVVLALAGGAFLLAGGDEPEVTLAPNTLAVLPFTVRGGEEVGVLAEGMVDLLSTKLDGAGELTSTDANAVLSLTRGATEAMAARELARRLGAGRYVQGSVLEYGGGLRLHASIHETEGSGEAIAEASAEGEAGSFLELVDELAAKLLVAGDLAPPGRMPRIAALTTESLEALKLFLEGERAIRGQRYGEAISLLGRAVEADTAFALAYYRMSVAASWEERHELRQRTTEQALRHGDRLTDRDRALVEAWAASKAGRHVEAERRYREIVRSHPDDLEAWYELAEVITHRGAFLGHESTASRAPFERALALDPGHGSSLFHLSNIAAGTGDLPLLDSITRLIRAQGAGSRDATIEAQWAFASGDSAAMERSLADLADPGTSPFAGYFALLGTDDPAAIRRMDSAAARGLPTLMHTALSRFVAERLAGLGFRDEGLARLERGDSEAAAADAVATTLLAVTPFLETPPAALERVRETLLAWETGPIRTEPVAWNFFQPHESLGPHLRLYLLALVENRLGRNQAALRLADELEAMTGLPEVRTLAADLARHVRAQVALDEARPDEALREIEGAGLWVGTPWDERASPVFSHRSSILLRAEALHEIGRYREAIRWYSADRSFVSWGYRHYRMAQAYEALGEPGPAAEHYAAFTRLWAEADPDLRPLVADARARLQALAAER